MEYAPDELPPVPPHIREKLLESLAERLRQEHPDAIVEVIDAEDADADHGEE